MYRFIYKVFHTGAGSRFWSRRRFTQAGRFLLLCVLVAALLGIDTDLTMTFQLFTLALAMLAVAFLATLVYRGRFEATRRLPSFVTAGERFSYRTRVTNGGQRMESAIEVLERLRDPRPQFKDFRADAPSWWRGLYPHWRRHLAQRQPGEIEVQQVAQVPPGQTVDVTMEGIAHRRGYLEFEAVTVARLDPLGLCRALRDLPRRERLLVLPKRYDLPELDLPGARIYQHGGVTLAASKGDSEEFVGLRDYRPGDPLKHIHWKSFARTRKPIVKEYQDEYFERHALVLETFTDAAGERVFEEAVSLAASFVCTLESQENLLDLLFVGDRTYSFTAGTGQLHTDSMLEILAGVRPCADDRFEDLREAVLQRRPSLSGCILVLIRWDQARRDLVDELSASGLPVRIFLITADESLVIDEPPAELRVLVAGKIEEGLAA